MTGAEMTGAEIVGEMFSEFLKAHPLFHTIAAHVVMIAVVYFIFSAHVFLFVALAVDVKQGYYEIKARIKGEPFAVTWQPLVLATRWFFWPRELWRICKRRRHASDC